MIIRQDVNRAEKLVELSRHDIYFFSTRKLN